MNDSQFKCPTQKHDMDSSQFEFSTQKFDMNKCLNFQPRNMLGITV